MALRERVADRFEGEFDRLRKKGLPAEAVYAGAWNAAIAEVFKWAEEWVNAPGQKDEWYPCDVSAVIAALQREAGIP